MSLRSVISVTGLSGSGKSVVLDGIIWLFDELPVINFKPEIEAEARRLCLNPQNGRELRQCAHLTMQAEGPDVFAQRAWPRIEAIQRDIIVLDGPRSPYCLQPFREAGWLIHTIALEAPYEIRRARVRSRARPLESQLTDQQLDELLTDEATPREGGFNVPALLAQAQYTIRNGDQPIAHTRCEVKRCLLSIMRDLSLAGFEPEGNFTVCAP